MQTRPRLKNERPTEFISLSDWMKESTQFNIISNIDFFRHYLIVKIFRSWSKNVKFRCFRRTREKLRREVLYCKPLFAGALLEVKDQVQKMSTLNLVNFNQWQHNKVDLEELKTHQKDFRSKTIREFENIIEKVADVAKSALKGILKKQGESRNGENEDSVYIQTVKKQKPLNLIRREKEEKRLRRRLIYENLHQRGLFLRCLQYIISLKCWEINRSNAKLIVQEIFRQKKQGPLLSTVIFGEDTLVEFSNDTQAIISAVESIIQENSKQLRDLPRIPNQPQFIELIKNYVDRENIDLEKNMIIDLQVILSKDQVITTIQQILASKIRNDFNNCENKVKENFKKCLAIHKDLDNKPGTLQVTDNLDLFKQRLSLMKDFRRLSSEYMRDLSFGVVVLEVKECRTGLETHIEDTLLCIKNVLTLKFQKMLEETKDDYQTIYSNLTAKVESLEDFCQLLELKNRISDREQELNHRKREIETIHKLLRSIGSSIKIHEKSQFEEILKLSERIETSRSTVNTFLEDNEEKYKALLLESIKEHQAQLLALQHSLSNHELIDPILTSDEVLSRLDLIKDKLKKVNQQHELLKNFW